MSVCYSGEAVPGDGFGACASWGPVPAWYLGRSAMVASCSDALCSVGRWMPVSGLLATDYVYVSDDGGGTLLLVSPGEVGLDASPGSAFDISELDFGAAASAFAASFVLVGMCWALGKGVGLVVGLVRRG